MSQQINLFNPVFRQQKKYFSSVTMLQALAVICLGCVVLAADAAMRWRSLQAQAATTDAMLIAKETQLTQFKTRYPPRARNAALAVHIVQAEQEVAMLQRASTTLATGGFGDVNGYSRYFHALARQRIEGLWLTEVTVADGGTRIGVQGNVLQASMVPQYMTRLAGEPAMRGKAFESLQIGQAGAPEAGVAAGGSTASALSYLQFSLQSTGAAAAAAEAPP